MFFRGHIDKAGFGSCQAPIVEVASMDLVRDNGNIYVGSSVTWYGSEDIPGGIITVLSGALYKCLGSDYPVLFALDERGNLLTLTKASLDTCQVLGEFVVFTPSTCDVFIEDRPILYRLLHRIYKIPLSLLTPYDSGISKVFTNGRACIFYSDGRVRSIGPEILQKPPYEHPSDFYSCITGDGYIYDAPFTIIDHPGTYTGDPLSAICYVLTTGDTFGGSDIITINLVGYFSRTGDTTFDVHYITNITPDDEGYTYDAGAYYEGSYIECDVNYQSPDIIVESAYRPYIIYPDHVRQLGRSNYLNRKNESDIFGKYGAVVGVGESSVFGFSFFNFISPYVEHTYDSSGGHFRSVAFGYVNAPKCTYSYDYAPCWFNYVPVIIDGFSPLFIGDDGSILYGYATGTGSRANIEMAVLTDGTFNGVRAYNGPSPAIETDDGHLVVVFNLIDNPSYKSTMMMW